MGAQWVCGGGSGRGFCAVDPGAQDVGHGQRVFLGHRAGIDQPVLDERGFQGDAGGFLFGRFSVADCMYAPVVSRFRTCGVALPPVVAAYCEKIMALPAMQDWMAAAKAEVAAGWK